MSNSFVVNKNKKILEDDTGLNGEEILTRMCWKKSWKKNFINVTDSVGCDKKERKKILSTLYTTTQNRKFIIPF